MRNFFPGYYRPSDEEFKSLWQNCIYIFDTNSLLNLYRYPTEARDDLLNFLERHSERVWIPFQVALEYQENRLSVIAEQVKRFREVKEILGKNLGSLEGDLGKLQLSKRHSVIKPDEFLEKIRQIVNQFNDELEILQKGQPNVYDIDLIRQRLDVIFESRIGSPPKDQAELDQIYKEGEIRFKRRIPPGYIDPKKKGRLSEKEGYHHGGLHYLRIFGDLILWKQILKHAEQAKIDKIIFITDDNTEDWWWIIESQGDKTIGPRSELIYEILSITNMKQFYMYNSDRFLKYANQYLGAQVKEESITQIRDIATVIGPNNMIRSYLLAEKAVELWLSQRYPNSIITRSEKFPDFVVNDANSSESIGYEVKYFEKINYLNIKNILLKSKNYSTESVLSRLNYVFVCGDYNLAKDIKQWISINIDYLPEGHSIILGILKKDDYSDLPKEFMVIYKFK